MRTVAVCLLVVVSTSAIASDWTHNGSVVSLQADGANRTFVYRSPRSGLPVTAGTLLFSGRKDGDSYSGKAYIFRRGCPPAPYSVSGPVSADQRSVRMTGQAPRLNAQCQVVGTRDDVLVFNFIDTAAAPVVHNTPDGDRPLSCDDKRRMGYVLDENEIDYCGGLARRGDTDNGKELVQEVRRPTAEEMEAQEERDREQRDAEQRRRDREREAEQERRDADIARHTLVVDIRSLDRYAVQLEFVSKRRANFSWPGNGQVYTLRDSEFHTYRLNCEPGEKICYGAWRDGNIRSYWGVGHSGDEGCENCCMTCGGKHRYTLQGGADSPSAGNTSASDLIDALAGGLAAGAAIGSAINRTPSYSPPPVYHPTRPAPRGRDSDVTGTRR